MLPSYYVVVLSRAIRGSLLDAMKSIQKLQSYTVLHLLIMGLLASGGSTQSHIKKAIYQANNWATTQCQWEV